MGTEKNVSSISIDVCRRTVIVKDHSGDSRTIECETTKQFLNAMKIISLTGGFRRKCVNMKSHWGHLLSAHPKIFLTIVKIMMGMNIEYDANAFTTFFEVKKGIRIKIK